jgi:hypothetical protein
MMTRLKLTLTAIDAGTYDYTALLGLLVSVAGLVVDAAGQADTLPPALAPYIVAAVPYARLVVLFGGFIAAQGKSLVVKGDA